MSQGLKGLCICFIYSNAVCKITTLSQNLCQYTVLIFLVAFSVKQAYKGVSWVICAHLRWIHIS